MLTTAIETFSRARRSREQLGRALIVPQFWIRLNLSVLDVSESRAKWLVSLPSIDELEFLACSSALETERHWRLEDRLNPSLYYTSLGGVSDATNALRNMDATASSVLVNAVAPRE